jgi:hypothetical protein
MVLIICLLLKNLQSEEFDLMKTLETRIRKKTQELNWQMKAKEIEASTKDSPDSFCTWMA